MRSTGRERPAGHAGLVRSCSGRLPTRSGCCFLVGHPSHGDGGLCVLPLPLSLRGTGSRCRWARPQDLGLGSSSPASSFMFCRLDVEVLVVTGFWVPSGCGAPPTTCTRWGQGYTHSVKTQAPVTGALYRGTAVFSSSLWGVVGGVRGTSEEGGVAFSGQPVTRFPFLWFHQMQEEERAGRAAHTGSRHC